MSYNPGGGGSSSIATSQDVALSNPANSQALAYDSVLQKWRNRTVGASFSLNVKDYGAIGDGATDDSAAFIAVMTAAKAATRTVAGALLSDPVGSVNIELPPGDYLITQTSALMGAEATASKAAGLTFRGQGTGTTNIIFDPASAANLATNDYWLDIKFEGISFLAATPGCTAFFFATTHNAQRYRFDNCLFVGWKYGVRLEGDNNNSEILFLGTHTSGIEASGAFFFIGDTNTSDQFLNYWFIGCSHWSTSAPYIDAAAGGSFHIWGLDVSDWGVGLSAPAAVFNLRGIAHALGVCNFEAEGVRVEAKNTKCRLLYSEWPQGNVTFRSTDWSSQAQNYLYEDIIVIKYLSTDGAAYAFYDSNLAGRVTIMFATNDWQHRHAVTFTSCNWLQRESPSDVVTYDTSASGGNNLTLPPVKFLRCRGTSNDPHVSTGVGATVWDDVTIGYRGELVQSLTLKSVAVRSIYGLPRDADAPYLRLTLPLGATITGLRAISPAGAVSDTGSGSWALKTTEGSPTTIATAAVTTAFNLGFNVYGAAGGIANIPFECSTSQKATLVIVPTGVTDNNPKGLILVEGYW